MDGLSTLSTPSFFNVGDHVLVSKGSGVGSIGTINQLSLDVALIVLDEDGEPRSPGLQPVSTEAHLSNLTRLFELGELVEVQLGVHKGRSGQVAEFDVEKQFMRIADLRQSELVSLISPHLDFSVLTFERLKCRQRTWTRSNPKTQSDKCWFEAKFGGT